MNGSSSCGTIYANQCRPDSLAERIRNQNGEIRLDLSLCNITKVPLTAIRDNYDGQPLELDLSYNSICFISPKFTWEMLYLTKLDLSKNLLKKLPDNFGNMQELVYLDLHMNQLQTLPASMGKMDRLVFLRISENPFRPPLRDFLGQTEPRISAVALAGLVVQFLQEFATAHTPEDQIQQPQPAKSIPSGKRRTSSKIHYQGGNIRVEPEDGSSTSSIASGAENFPEMDPNYPKIPMPNLERALRQAGKQIFILALIVITTSVCIARCVDTSFMEYIAENYPFFGTIWQFYKPVHLHADYIARLIPDTQMFSVKAPKKQIMENWSFFGWIASFINFFTW